MKIKSNPQLVIINNTYLTLILIFKLLVSFFANLRFLYEYPKNHF